MLCIIVCRIARWLPVGNYNNSPSWTPWCVTFLVLVFRNPSLLSVHYWEMLATKNPDAWNSENGRYLDPRHSWQNFERCKIHVSRIAWYFFILIRIFWWRYVVRVHTLNSKKNISSLLCGDNRSTEKTFSIVWLGQSSKCFLLSKEQI